MENQEIDVDFLKEKNILYVEDDELAQKLLMRVLSRRFNKIFSASDGKEGLEIYQNKSSEIDLIITDIQMPNLDGLEMAKQIKRQNSNIPIVITSAFNDSDYLRRSEEIKIDEYLNKPIEIQSLIRIIHDILKKKK